MWHGLVGIISRTAERNDCVSFRILQEYDNLRNGTPERTVIGRNGTLILILTLCLTLPNPNPKNNRNLCGRVPEIHSNIPLPSVDYSFFNI